MKIRLLVRAACLLLAMGTSDALYAQTPAAQASSTPSDDVSPTLPETIPLFPLPDTVLFPNMSVPLHVFEPRYLTMLADALKGNRIIGMVQLRPGYEADYEKSPAVFPIGCAGVISEVHEKPDGEYDIVLRALVKFQVTRQDSLLPYRVARVTALPEVLRPEDRATLHERRERLDVLLAAAVERLGFSPVPAAVPDEVVVDALAQYMDMDTLDRQKLLERDGVVPRATALITRLEAMLAAAPAR